MSKLLSFLGLEVRPWPRPVRAGLVLGLGLLLAVLTYYGLLSDRPLPDHRLIVNWNDVVLHASAFGALSVAAVALFSPVVRVCVMVFGIGLVLELLQLGSAHHEPSLRDVLANGLGVVLAGGLLGASSRVIAAVRDKTSANRATTSS